MVRQIWKMRKPMMGIPMTPETTETMTMMAVGLISLVDFWMMKTAMLTMNMQKAMKMLVMNSMKYRQLRFPMQVPRKPQWWSNISTQFWQYGQWLVLFGLKMWQVSQNRPEVGALPPEGSTRNFQYFKWLSSRQGLFGMIPGLLQEVKCKKKYMRKMQMRKIIGKAGFTFQFYPTTKMQKGITIPSEQQYIYSMPGISLLGPATQHPKQKRLFEGQFSYIFGINIIIIILQNLPLYLLFFTVWRICSMDSQNVGLFLMPLFMDNKIFGKWQACIESRARQSDQLISSQLQLRKANPKQQIWESCNITDAEVQYIASREGKQIQIFKLGKNNLSSQSIVHLAASSWQNLLTIELSSNKIRDRGCRLIVKARWRNLRELWLFNNQVGEIGAAHLAKGYWKHLALLHLSHNQVGLGVQALTKGNWRWLKKIYLRWNQIHFLALQKILKGNWGDIIILWLSICQAISRIQFIERGGEKLYKSMDQQKMVSAFAAYYMVSQ